MNDPMRIAGVLAMVMTLTACVPAEPPPSGIPITTESQVAREAYLTGRDLAEKLRATDAREHFQKAIVEDPGFALAHFSMATAATTGAEFFEHLDKARSLADRASEGERLLILALVAGTNGDPQAQRSYLERLVASFPEDERAQNALATFHFGQQEFQEAITRFKRASSIDPDYSPPYNMLGYAQRAVGQYEAAEESFRTYIDLIPDEPNPYDSYAELLMKLGRFDESIENYRKALELDSGFTASLVGIGNNQMFKGDLDGAGETFRALLGQARNDAERRQAHFGLGMLAVHQGKTDAAVAALEAMRGVAEATGDWGTVAGDETTIGDVLIEAGRLDDAAARYRASLTAIEKADVPDEVKETVRRNHHYYEARIAVARGDLDTARQHARQYRTLVGPAGIPGELRQYHELTGRIALAEGDYESATRALGSANKQNPRVLLLTAKALSGAGSAERARSFCERAANFNQLGIDYALARRPAMETLADL